MRPLAFPADLATPPRVVQLAIGVHERGEPGRWRLPGLWCLHLYTYHASISVDGVRLAIAPGHAGITPPGAALHYTFAGRSLHAYAHFALAAGAPTAALPAMQDLGARFAGVDAALRAAIGWHATAPARAAARLWDVLWQLAAGDAQGRATHPLVEQARHLIELRLAEPLSVAWIARRLGCSHNHLTRLFRRDLGSTVIGYLRARRVARARALVEHSTLPLSAIAAEVGFADAQRFNKAVRRECGCAPRQLRYGLARGR